MHLTRDRMAHLGGLYDRGGWRCDLGEFPGQRSRLVRKSDRSPRAFCPGSGSLGIAVASSLTHLSPRLP